ncbi:hypothetical protein DFJ63DRAFT_334672 [Scheffersomyces coipomensis]|uniref:uncharacterized protein n=1 Tax=Scheffersomyces coipomensis TaxID=1788519 RepID=UPI00315C7EF5
MDDDIDRLLSLEESQLSKDQEIARILACDAYDYFAILNLNPFLYENEDAKLLNVVKRTYRRRSLLIHPDKTSNPDAPIAFDKFKKAESILSINLNENVDDIIDIAFKNKITEKKRLIDIYKECKKRLRLSDDEIDTSSLEKVRKEVSSILEEEVEAEEREKLYQQHKEAAKLSEETRRIDERQLKREMENKWENDRDTRVKSWRSYTNKVEKKNLKKKKKITKPKVLA